MAEGFAPGTHLGDFEITSVTTARNEAGTCVMVNLTLVPRDREAEERRLIAARCMRLATQLRSLAPRSLRHCDLDMHDAAIIERAAELLRDHG